MSSITERVFRRLLAEGDGAPDTTDLAATVRQTGSNVTLVLYNTSALFKQIKKTLRPDFDVSTVLLGMIAVRPTDEPCLDAWQVKAAAGKGHGKLLYALAYAETPSGLLVPDRSFVSKSATAAWARAKGDPERRYHPLDDASLPPEERRTPEDPSDDCKVHGGKFADILDNAYVAKGWEHTVAFNLKRAHKLAMREAEKLGVNGDLVTGQLTVAGLNYFTEKFSDEINRGL